jgi:hypothetical protein
VGYGSLALARLSAAGGDEPGGSGGEERGGAISKLETGQRGAYPSTIRKLAAGLDVEPQMLVGGVEYLEEKPAKGPSKKAKDDKDRKIGF